MKTLKNVVPFVLFLSLTVLIPAFISCGKSDNEVAADDCTPQVKVYSDAANAYVADPTNKAKCEAFVKAANTFFKSSCFQTFADKQSRDAAQQTLTNADCD